MALNNLGLGLLLTAKDMASGVIERVEEAITKLGDKSALTSEKWKNSMATFGRGAMLFGVGMSGLTASWGLAEAAMPLETSLADAGARLDATTEEMERMKQAAYDAAAAMPNIATPEAAAALDVLARKTGDVDKAIQMLNPTLGLSQALEMDGAQAAGVMAQALKAFGAEAGDAASVGDQMVWMMKRWRLTGEELTQVMGPLAYSSENAGDSFQNAMTAFGLAKSQTADASRALMSVQRAYMQLADPDLQTKIDKQLGSGMVSLVDSSTGRLKSLTQVALELSQAMQGMTQAQRTNAVAQIFGSRTAGGMTAVMDALEKGIRGANGELLRGPAALQAIASEAAHTEGTLEEFQRRREDTTAWAMERMSAGWKDFKAAVGEAFLPVFKQVADTLAKVFKAISDWVRGLSPETKKFLGYLVVGLSALATFGGALMMLKGIIGMVSVAMSVFGAASTVALGPLLLIIAAVAAIAAAAYLVIKYWDDIVGALSAAWEWWEQLVWDTYDAIAGWISDVGSWFEDLGSGIASFFTDTIPNAIGSAASAVGDWLSDLGSSIGSFFTDTIPNAVLNMGRAVKDALTSFGTRVYDFFAVDIPEAVRKAAKAVKDFVLDIPVVGTALKGLGSAYDWVSDKATGFLDYVGLNVGSPVSVEQGGLYDVISSGFRVPGTAVHSAPHAPAVAVTEAAAEQRRGPSAPPAPRQQEMVTQPIEVRVDVDSETVARAVARAQRAMLAREFAPTVPEET